MSFEAFIKGWIGEQGTRLAQKLTLDSNQYHTFYDLLIEDGSRSTQIDHIIVSKFGIFVVETKNFTGWIYGSSDDSFWTQNIYGTKNKFQNPLRQNYLHTKSIANVFSIDNNKIHSIVVFWGDCTFKTKMPKNVLKWQDYISFVKSKNQILLTEEEVADICEKLKALNGHIPILTNIKNANVIKNQVRDSSKCPKCNGKLIERIVRNGENAGQKFIGCENYPRCRYTRDK